MSHTQTCHTFRVLFILLAISMSVMICWQKAESTSNLKLSVKMCCPQHAIDLLDMFPMEQFDAAWTIKGAVYTRTQRLSGFKINHRLNTTNRPLRSLFCDRSGTVRSERSSVWTLWSASKSAIAVLGHAQMNCTKEGKVHGTNTVRSSKGKVLVAIELLE